MTKTTLAMMVGGCLLAASLAPAAEPAPAGATTNAPAVKRQEKCPIMGGNVDRTKYVDQDGVRIYVCCNGCLAPLKKDFAAIRAKLEKEGVVLDKTPAAANP